MLGGVRVVSQELGWRRNDLQNTVGTERRRRGGRLLKNLKRNEEEMTS